MSKIPAILSATLTVSLVACGGKGGSDHTPIGQPMTTPLVTPASASASSASPGTLTVFNSTDGLFITADAAPGWELLETRLAVSTSLQCIPQSKTGTATADHFLLRRKGGSGITELAYNLPLLVQPGTLLYIALEADVRLVPAGTPASGSQEDDHHVDCGGDDGGTSSWALGTAFPGNDGSMYLTYTIRAAAPPSLAGRYLTYTQADWGDPSLANPAAAYLAANFSAAFPGGVTIGSANFNSALFTSAQMVSTFLPQSGAPAALLRRMIDPPNLMNPFAGETLALTLNTVFDSFDPAFSAGPVPLSSLVVADPASPFYGLTVADVLANANALLSGQPQSVPVSLADTYDAVSRINANFENGTTDLGFLGLP